MNSLFMRRLAVAACACLSAAAGSEGLGSNPNWDTFRKPNSPIGEHAGIVPGQMPFGATVQSAAAQSHAEELPAPGGEQLVPDAMHGQTAPRVPLAPPTQPRMPAPPPVAPPVHQHHNPAPAPQTHYQTPQHHPAPAPMVHSAPGVPCQSCNNGSHASHHPAAGSWEPNGQYACPPPVPVQAGPQPISPYFGGLDLLFWNLANSNRSALITYDNGVPVITNDDLDPDTQLGFDAHVGRYIGCGRYGLDFGYMLWDPGTVSQSIFDNGAGLRLTIPALQTVSINRGGGATTVYDDYDTNATRIRASRDMRVQSAEVNLVSFGLMGARRLGSCAPASLFGNADGGHGHHGYRPHSTGFFGGATGPLARACSGRVRVLTSHGFRWFQLEDDLEIAGEVDGVGGYGAEDLYYDLETENNLFGYQFGSRLSYCLGGRTMINIGGKAGVYGNDARFVQRLGTRSIMAYTDSQGAGPGDIYTEQSDVGIAALCEVDLGLGYRISNRLTARGGYRVLAASGVATTVGQMPVEYTTAASAGLVRADNSLILHGAYVGFDYNW